MKQNGTFFQPPKRPYISPPMISVTHFDESSGVPLDAPTTEYIAKSFRPEIFRDHCSFWWVLMLLCKVSQLDLLNASVYCCEQIALCISWARERLFGYGSLLLSSSLSFLSIPSFCVSLPFPWASLSNGFSAPHFPSIPFDSFPSLFLSHIPFPPLPFP